jgi:hypothetical protein
MRANNVPMRQVRTRWAMVQLWQYTLDTLAGQFRAPPGQAPPARSGVKQSEERRARAAAYDSQVLRHAVHANSPNEVDWLLTAAIVTDAAKRRYCLERALAIKPESELARQALAKLSN